MAMKDWIEYKGIRCTTIGIHVTEYPPTIIPAERLIFTNVPGRSGALTQKEGNQVYDDVTLPFKFYCADPTPIINNIAGYFSGNGDLRYPYRPGFHYKARVINQIPLAKVLRERPNRTFTVNFRCKPFAYMDNVQDVTIDENMTFLNNPCSVESEPTITVNGSGDITLMIGMQIIELKGVDGSITINSELRETYNDDELLNSQMIGEFPVLVPGNNAVTWDGEVTSVVVSPNWRSL